MKMTGTMRQTSLFLMCMLLMQFIENDGFLIRPKQSLNNLYPTRSFKFELHSSTLPDISTMRVGELKKELESYGLSTKSFFEKSELVDAVEKARAEGKSPIGATQTSSFASSSSFTDNDDSSNNDPRKKKKRRSASSTPEKSRDELIAEEMTNCSSMKAGEMKKELESMGISTRSFFEKSEFLRALAEARVDGVAKESTTSTSAGGQREKYAEYADVEVLTGDDSGPRKRSQGQQQQRGTGGNPFGGGAPGAGGNPFGGGMGGMEDILKNMGGMGGMGGMEDILKNMGGMGNGGGNPFGGAGGPGGADPMKKVQEMMGNPKVREIMMKAQSNPKVMRAVTECMGNPAAFMKYQNDPEIGEIIRDLQKYM